MSEEKKLEYAECLRDDVEYSLEIHEEIIMDSKSVETITWLIEQAKRAKMYESALRHITSGTSDLPAATLARHALLDAEQRFQKK